MTIRLHTNGDRRPLLRGEVSAASRMRLARLTWSLIAATALFVAWLLWHYGLANEMAARLPAWLRDLLGLLTSAAVLTLGILWGLVVWQRRLHRSRTEVPDIAELYALSPRDFEHFVAGLFEQRGYTVEVRGRSGDLGVDLLLAKPDGRRAIVQCKRYRHTIGPDIVRELFGTMVHERAMHGFLVTTADISDAARQWARDKPITLIDGRTLIALA